MSYNVYCDESCHLQNDNSDVMGIGSIILPIKKLKEINQRIKEIKLQHGIPAYRELKWTSVSPSKLSVYEALINYFFDNSDLCFRVIVIPEKNKLDHNRFNQTHDDWYYKMYFEMLKVIFDPKHHYDIYIDIKDSNSYQKATKLKEVCCNSVYDFSSKIIKKIQPIRSEEVQIMQLVDLLIGAIVFRNRFSENDDSRSNAKNKLVNLIKKRSGYELNRTTLLMEKKMNVFIWSCR